MGQALAKQTQDTMKSMDSNTDTVGQICVIPHTPSAMSRSLPRIIEEGMMVVSVDPCGGLMGALFSDGSEGLYWYRSPKSGSDFGLN
jgi:hypothetical protein